MWAEKRKRGEREVQLNKDQGVITKEPVTEGPFMKGSQSQQYPCHKRTHHKRTHYERNHLSKSHKKVQFEKIEKTRTCVQNNQVKIPLVTTESTFLCVDSFHGYSAVFMKKGFRGFFKRVDFLWK
jgi:hypothetical protein